MRLTKPKLSADFVGHGFSITFEVNHSDINTFISFPELLILVQFLIGQVCESVRLVVVLLVELLDTDFEEGICKPVSNPH